MPVTGLHMGNWVPVAVGVAVAVGVKVEVGDGVTVPLEVATKSRVNGPVSIEYMIQL